MKKDHEIKKLSTSPQTVVKPLTKEQREFVRKMEKRLPYLEQRLKEQRTSPELETMGDEET